MSSTSGELSVKPTITHRETPEAAAIAAQLAIGVSIAALVLLASLHILSPEYDPAWRMISEYANGKYGWVLSLMFAAWGLSSWALAFALRSEVRTSAGKIGLVFLIAAGVGESMASVFDINSGLHDLAGFIGVGSLPVAAMLISLSLSRTSTWSEAGKAPLWTANLTWISLVLFVVSFVVLMVTYTQVAGALPTEAPAALPPGVIALVGWANRLLVVVYCLWVMIVARQAIQLRRQPSAAEGQATL